MPAPTMHTPPSTPAPLLQNPTRWMRKTTRCKGPPILSVLGAPDIPHQRESCASQPGLLLLAPLARRTDQVLHLEAYGTWWRGSWFWFFFYFWFCILCRAHPFPCFRSMPSNSRVPSAVGGYDTPAASHRSPCVTGAFWPDGLAFTRPCKIFQAKVFKE